MNAPSLSSACLFKHMVIASLSSEYLFKRMPCCLTFTRIHLKTYGVCIAAIRIPITTFCSSPEAACVHAGLRLLQHMVLASISSEYVLTQIVFAALSSEYLLAHMALASLSPEYILEHMVFASSTAPSHSRSATAAAPPVLASAVSRSHLSSSSLSVGSSSCLWVAMGARGITASKRSFWRQCEVT